MLFFKLAVATATIQSVLSCPAAKKTNLRTEDVEDYHRKLSQIIGVESQRLEVNSQMNAPVCGNILFTGVAGPSRVAYTAAGTVAANNAIQAVYQGLRTDFYQLVDAYQNGTPLPAWATAVSLDPLSLFPNNVAAPLNLSLNQKAYRIANLVGNALRLAFHDAGEVDIRTLDVFGSDGCLADNGPNSGLKEVNTVTNTIIETAWQRYCDKITRADFWTLFAKIAAEGSLPNGRFATFVAVAAAVGGVVVPPNPSPYMPYLNIPYQYGRKDAVGDCNGGSFRADGVTPRLPGHQPGLSEFSEVYVRQMGLDVRTGVVLSGAHSTGHVHTAFSGFGHNDNLAALELDPLTNAWDETPWVFDNIYFDSLAIEFWLNNGFQANVNQNEGGNPANPSPFTPVNSGANFWAVQVAPGIQQPVPACVDTATCGVIPIAAAVPPVPGAAALIAAGGIEVIFCVVNGVTRYTTQSLEVNPGTAWTTLNAFTNRAVSTNPCNCAQFFSIPPLLDSAILTARGCALGPHPKTIMLNADMVQNFPISGTGPVKNLISANPGAIQNIGVGDIGELCSPIVVVSTAVGTTTLNANQAAANRNLVFPQVSLRGRVTNLNCAGVNALNLGCPLNPVLSNTAQGFGCVKNSVGNPANFLGVANVQTMGSTLLPKDPNTPSVSLWATVQSFMTLGLAGSCIQGVSTYSNPLDGNRNPYTGALQTAVPNYATYSGSVKVAPAARQFIGQNLLSTGGDVIVPCNEATPPFGEGRDNFYREFEVAFVKMVTAGFTYSHTFTLERIINGVRRTVTVPVTASGNGKMGILTDIILRNPRQTRANINRCARPPTPALPTLLLPGGVTFTEAGRMTGGPLFGSSTCCIGEIC